MSFIKIASSPKACASTLGPTASRLKRNRNCRCHLACDVETLRDFSFPPRPIAAPSPLLWIESRSAEPLHKHFGVFRFGEAVHVPPSVFMQHRVTALT